MEWIIGAVFVLWVIGKLGSGKGASKRAKVKRQQGEKSHAGFSVSTIEHTGRQGGIQRGRKEFDIAQWESELISIWSGDPLPVTFTYHGHRRQVQVRELLHHPNGHVFILGHCSYRDEDRYFDLAKLDTMILMKSKRYDAHDWLVRVLGEDRVCEMDLVL
jgi:hypothetical protein